jgi:hypothetical protein
MYVNNTQPKKEHTKKKETEILFLIFTHIYIDITIPNQQREEKKRGKPG